MPTANEKLPRLPQRAISRFQASQKLHLEVIEMDRSFIATALLDLIPASLSKWKAEAGGSTVNGLLQYGAASSKFRRDEFDPPTYGYTDLTEFAKRFDKLRLAWKDIVKIKISWDGTYRFEVTFTAI